LVIGILRTNSKFNKMVEEKYYEYKTYKERSIFKKLLFIPTTFTTLAFSKFFLKYYNTCTVNSILKKDLQRKKLFKVYRRNKEKQ
jgi:hypothetical protein